MKKRSILIASSTIILLASYYFASPLISLYFFAQTIKRKDVNSIERYINYELLKQNLTSQLYDYVYYETYKEVSGQSNSKLTMAILSPLIREIVKSTVNFTITPEGLKILLDSGDIKNINKSAFEENADLTNNQQTSTKIEKQRKKQVSFYYLNINEFVLKVLPSGSEKPIYSTWQRRSLIEWELTKIKLPL